MDKQRRKFLKIAGASVVAGISAPAIMKLSSSPAIAASSAHVEASATGGHGEHGSDAPKKVRLGMVIDMRKLAERPDLLDNAITACGEVHNIPKFPNKKDEIKWIWKVPFENAFTDLSVMRPSKIVRETQFPVLCNHCDNPPCTKACPTQATFKFEPTGVVVMDYHRCIGCRFCMAACPYGARSFNWVDPRPYIEKYNVDFPSRTKGVVEKCNFCGHRLALGLEPACVEACKEVGAITFGDLNDPESEISQILDKEFTLQRKPTVGTKPSVFYIV